MSIHVALNHVTRYRYGRSVLLSPQLVRLRPAPHCRTRVLSYSMRVTPEEHFVNWQQDPQSNYVARVFVPERVREFRVEVDLVAEMAVYNPFDFFLEPDAEHVPFAYASWQRRELLPFLEPEAMTPGLARYLDTLGRPRGRTTDFLVELNRRLSADIGYLIRMEPGVQTPDETLARGNGSCRDTSWLLVQILRHMGFAARFVSGYLIQLKADVPAREGPSGVAADFTDLHAWCEVYLPGAGWIGFDPTSGLLAGEGHLPLACTPDASSAAPVTGGVEPCEVEFEHAMHVTRVHESPRVTLPYSEAQWEALLRAGDAVDARLVAADVRLTMGGEPTFVSESGRDADEWNTEAIGPSKRQRALDLHRRLRASFGPGGLLHVGQGKWYPGEQLPRWALSCFWRADGVPMWHDDALMADEHSPAGHSAADAERFIRTLAAHLGVGDTHVQAGYEDTWYYLWRERRLPVNVDPFDARLADPLERDRLARVFEATLGTAVGWVLPLDADPADPARWRSGPWPLRQPRLYLLPGDSPMGYRLPVDALPWVAEADRRYLHGRDPFAPVVPLPPSRVPMTEPGPRWQRLPVGSGHDESGPTGGLRAGPWRDGARTDGSRPVRRFESAPWVVRTALCVEARGGVLWVFMPPLEALEAYLALLTAIEATAAATDLPVLIEGYPPPDDARVRSFSVTPDPGVIEVNVPPVSTWRQLVDTTTTVYGHAHQSGLSAEKFMLDGRHTGTGGGNHLVLGGETPDDSPFLRRPDLLRSLVTYWNNHPSLSFLFSGLFIGPTSQAPRVDEARHDSLYELDIAFAQVPSDGAPTPPWLVDRLFRNLLVDVTGNTHRAEFCIDKLYSPAGGSGRRGLLELRAFEMPPHPRMSLAQQLLLRALVARFWAEPYRAPLTRWGTLLHDRFMLPHYVWRDFVEVLDETRAAGFALHDDWYRPHVEFRFPLAGAFTVRELQVTLRTALEPWHVLGEEGAAGGTVRYVDSSVERLEVLVRGIAGERFVLTCNGTTIPLQPTGRTGEAVAGVRYRAWQPPSCLHPTIPVHAPLTFDVVDTWAGRSLGGGQYHVMHPGGRNYEQFPVNSYEAESRRLARFTELAHTPGTVVPRDPPRLSDFPHTLDLRRV
ncbi:MAG: DUF2126 domain-containing protein [Vicinamibacterales bacterium]